MRSLRIALVLLVVLAGCGGGVSTPTVTNSTDTPAPTESPTPAVGSITVVGGELPIEPAPVFSRILTMTETRVQAPTVQVESNEGAAPGILDTDRSPFRASLGIVPREDRSNVTLTAYTPADGYTVHLYETVLADPTGAESTLAHELVHVVQFRTGWGGEMWNEQARLDYDETSDSRTTYYLVLEGAATYVQDRYERAYLPTVRPTAMERKRTAYRNASGLARLSLARYHYGSQYVAEHVDSPADLAGIHLDAPNSTEQVLHDTRDPIAPLSVSADEAEGWNVADRDRMGELFLRIALRTELNRSTAVAVADGWGDDRKIAYTNGEAAGYAWVLTWDDEANATEFVDGFRRYLDRKATRQGELWVADERNSTYRLERVSDRTVVVFLGNESFVGNATADTANGEVVVEP